jgi:steroid delta-isomerase-like uncharacterized protein
MYLVAQHRIYDVPLFWSTAEQLFAILPPHRRLLQRLCDVERRCCVCLWETDSLEAIADRFDQAVGHISVNTYFEVDETIALGLPAAPGTTQPVRAAPAGKRSRRGSAGRADNGSVRKNVALERIAVHSSALEVARRFTDDAWNRRDLKALDRLLAPEFIDHDPLLPEQGTGREGFLQTAAAFFSAFPDLHARNLELLEAGESVVLRWTAYGTHHGALKGIPPTGRRVRLKGVVVLRIAGGRIVERWGEFDALGLMRQLGMEMICGATTGNLEAITGRLARGCADLSRARTLTTFLTWSPSSPDRRGRCSPIGCAAAAMSSRKPVRTHLCVRSAAGPP